MIWENTIRLWVTANLVHIGIYSTFFIGSALIGGADVMWFVVLIAIAFFSFLFSLPALFLVALLLKGLQHVEESATNKLVMLLVGCVVISACCVWILSWFYPVDFRDSLFFAAIISVSACIAILVQRRTLFETTEKFSHENQNDLTGPHGS